MDSPRDEYSWGITQILLKRPVDLVIDMNVYDDLRWGQNEKDEADQVRKKCEEEGITFVGLESYPINGVIDKFDTDYFTSTVDYAIALALYMNYKDIHLYGMTMDGNSDYYKIKCGCDFWCGMAKGMGRKITTHGITTVMRAKDGLLYGYDKKQRPLS